MSCVDLSAGAFIENQTRVCKARIERYRILRRVIHGLRRNVDFASQSLRRKIIQPTKVQLVTRHWGSVRQPVRSSSFSFFNIAV